ncbi:MAG: hypothetical protein S4CHLAM37_16060 [Chlamydiia bacterium]|nr:hypothetical protein [Chlamydiia bacterium]
MTVLGFIDMSDGLGRQSLELIQALKDDVDVGFKPTRKSKLADVPDSVASYLETANKKLGKIVIYEDVLYPISHTYFTKKFKDCPDSQIRFAYTMLESSKIPKRWALTLNEHFDAALVPDEFLIKVYKDSGVTIPIFVVPLGLNLNEFEAKPLKKKANIPFTFANFGTCISRKNHKDLILAFHEAFGDDPRVKLWINCKYSADNLFENLQSLVKELGVSNISLTNKCFSKEEYVANFDLVDCYVNTTKSEGFSIQPREAMTLGIPCIVSDNTAQKTICKSGLVKSVPTSHTEPAYYEFFADISGERYVPDYNKTVEALLDVYNNYEKYLMKSEKMKKWALNYKYTNLHNKYKTIVKPKKLRLGKENCIDEDTLTTNSEKLYKKFKKIL